MNTMEFKFKAENNGIMEKKVEIRLADTGYWPHIMEEFVCFLRGVGYIIPAGEFVSDEEIEDLRKYAVSGLTNDKCKGCSCGKEKESNEEGTDKN